MKRIIAIAIAALLALPVASFAADAKAESKSDTKSKSKPYPLETCLVTDEKLGADASMKPYSFVEDGQEIKLCCKSCLKDFKKDKTKLMKKIAAAEKKKSK